MIRFDPSTTTSAEFGIFGIPATEIESKIILLPVKQGSGINFIYVESKLKYELNKQSLENHNLKVSATLESQAVK